MTPQTTEFDPTDNWIWSNRQLNIAPQTTEYDPTDNWIWPHRQLNMSPQINKYDPTDNRIWPDRQPNMAPSPLILTFYIIWSVTSRWPVRLSAGLWLVCRTVLISEKGWKLHVHASIQGFGSGLILTWSGSNLSVQTGSGSMIFSRPDPDPDTSVLKIFHRFYDYFW